MTLENQSERNRLYSFCKRASDLLIALSFLIAGWPIFLIIAASIKLDTKGPVFYRGRRSGKLGKPFQVLKFRTMEEECLQLNNFQNNEKVPLVAGGSSGKNDPRVTNIGKFLRRTKLDELPQFLNVLKGEMSIVGPRPELIEYTNLYQGEEKQILSVKPGITDFSSIEFIKLDQAIGGENPDWIYENKVMPIKNRLRLKYVKNKGFKTDIFIFYRTITRLVGF